MRMTARIAASVAPLSAAAVVPISVIASRFPNWTCGVRWNANRASRASRTSLILVRIAAGARASLFDGVVTSAYARSMMALDARWGQRPCVIEPGYPTLSYEEMDALATRVRDRLISAGLRRGDRIG